MVDPHPTQYKVGWIKREDEAQINEICTVPVYLGNSYKDQMVCDILEMAVTKTKWFEISLKWMHAT